MAMVFLLRILVYVAFAMLVVNVMAMGYLGMLPLKLVPPFAGMGWFDLMSNVMIIIMFPMMAVHRPVLFKISLFVLENLQFVTKIC